MKQAARFAIGLMAAATLAGGGGYWLGTRSERGEHASTVAATASGNEGIKIERKPLYYRNPMGLPDTSPIPKKDPMGMAYVPVYADEGSEPDSSNQIRISTEKVQKLGVRTETAGLRMLNKIVRSSGRVTPDERRTYTIAPKFEGYVERLHVNITGQPVSQGQPLFEVYSPELVSAQREYAIAAQGVQAMQNADSQALNGMQELAQSTLMRLKNWDISEEQIKALAKSGTAKHTLTFRSPVSGIVTEKQALQGMRFMPGEALYQVADLASVWVLADVFEQDIGLVETGAQAQVKIGAYPDQVFAGTITYVYPTLNAETRTVPVRIELANPAQLLKPAMFAQVELPVGSKEPVLSVPDSAVIDSGTRRIVLVQIKEGRFEPREVRLGARGDNYVEILDGIADGEQVVIAANFLIDAESNLKAAIGGLGSHAGHGNAAATGPVSSTAKPTGVGHKAEGRVESLDIETGTLSLNHGPVETLQWPAMTMAFKVANPALLKDLEPGARVSVEFVERQPDEWVITQITPAASTTAPASANPHAGH